MNITDPIADMLTRIRNASSANKEWVDVPASNMKKELAEILLKEGYVKTIESIDDGKQGVIRISLKYVSDSNVSGPSSRVKAIRGLRRISKPGLRVYANRDELPKVLGGLGIAIISTSKGIMTDRDARKEGVGGEVLAYVW